MIVQAVLPVLLNSSTYPWPPANPPSAPMPIHGMVAVHLCTAAGAADTADAANAGTDTATAVHAMTMPAALMRMLNLIRHPSTSACPPLQSGQDQTAG